ncbi:hypothetical protein BCR43DRAFT_494253 [Syncephalastrum racemosum]|uniref:Uncharacterized protein n=1 Tax=Syncephalastrum racemosum TaxID=13706 RepID=A0A1X2H930_SYNRA|nr:hypothetical protein BCR43DRAFT_494253 [Syncephalastrum racemosum]
MYILLLSFLLSICVSLIGALPMHNADTERMARLISTHWQYEHLDTIRASSHRDMAALLQQHVTLHCENPEDGTVEDMRMLRTQLEEAMQSHAESHLIPGAWELLAMSTNALQTLVKETIEKHKVRRSLASKLDGAMVRHLRGVFHQLDHEIMPRLLDRLVEELAPALDQVNQNFPFAFSLKVTPWSPESHDPLHFTWEDEGHADQFISEYYLRAD